MSLILSGADLDALSRAMQLLAAPLDHASVDEWRSRVNRALKELLGADTAGFHLPGTDGPLFYTDDYPAELLDAYEMEPPPLPDGTSMVERGTELQVSTLERAYGCHVDRYHRSAYYNEYAAQVGKHDTIFTICSLGGPDPEALASVQLFHERPTGRRFGDREIGLLRLLFPALQAGAQTYARWGAYRRDLLSALDRLALPALVLNAQERVLHQTPALAEALAGDVEAELLREAVLEVGRTVCGLLRGSRFGAAPELVREARTASGRYRVRGCLHGEGGAGALVLVALERLTPRPRPEAELRELFGLTAAEARVAMLLARGLSNAEIAAELSVSPHTVRRHTERSFQKLGVRTRAEVASRVLS